MPDEIPTETSAVILARMEVKLDHALASQADHESRIRALESPSADNDHEKRIRELEGRKSITPSQLWTAVCSAVGLVGVIVGIVVSAVR